MRYVSMFRNGDDVFDTSDVCIEWRCGPYGRRFVCNDGRVCFVSDVSNIGIVEEHFVGIDVSNVRVRARFEECVEGGVSHDPRISYVCAALYARDTLIVCFGPVY